MQQHHPVVKSVLHSTVIQTSPQHESSRAPCSTALVCWLNLASLVAEACTQQTGTTLQRCLDSPSSGLQSSELSLTLQKCHMFRQVLT